MSQKERDAFVAGVLWDWQAEIKKRRDFDLHGAAVAESSRRYPDETPAPAGLKDARIESLAKCMGGRK